MDWVDLVKTFFAAGAGSAVVQLFVPIQTNRNAPHADDQEHPDWETKLPELGPYPDDEDGWQAIDRKLANRCLGLRNKIAESQSIIRDVMEHVMDDLKDTLDEQSAKCGLEAWTLAVELRQRNRVEEVNPDWNYAEVLEETLPRAIKSKEERNTRRAKDKFVGF
jgi:hypothetical protein